VSVSDTGDCRKLHYEELRKVFTSKVIEWDRHVARMGDVYTEF
jgi:hypothetical protein